MPTFTTDVRMEKVRDLEACNKMEGVFWVKEVMSQWRVAGRGVVVGEEGAEEEKKREVVWEGVRVRPGMDGKGVGETGEWSWKRMVTSYFANHSPVLRGVFFPFFFAFLVSI